jgi:hypothetical protein
MPYLVGVERQLPPLANIVPVGWQIDIAAAFTLFMANE